MDNQFKFYLGVLAIEKVSENHFFFLKFLYTDKR